MGVIGVRSKGKALINDFRNVRGTRVVAISDVDSDVLRNISEALKEENVSVKTYSDMRQMFDDPEIDAVAIATPNHWHSLAAIWACQAGKDVYVEKPVCHNIWEGRQAVKAAQKYNRIVQAGTQNRSDPGLAEAFDYIHQGNLGKIRVVRGFCYKRRGSIGKVDRPQPVPESVDYNLWCGPAPVLPLMRKSLHYDWHWIWNTGNGDLGNQGIHEVDLCRWALGEETVAPRAMSIGGRFGYDDDGETPNTQIAILDYDSAPIIFEVRGLKSKKDAPAMDHYRNIRTGLVVECEQGYFAGGSGGGWIHDHDGSRVKQFRGTGGGGHAGNFIKAVRSRKVEDLNAWILKGHISSSLCHQAGISHRLGSLGRPEEIREAIEGNKDSLETFERFQTHLAANEIDLTKTPAVLGPWLKMDVEKERFVDTEERGKANKLLTRRYRKPFVVPSG